MESGDPDEPTSQTGRVVFDQSPQSPGVSLSSSGCFGSAASCDVGSEASASSSASSALDSSIMLSGRNGSSSPGNGCRPSAARVSLRVIHPDAIAFAWLP